MSFQGLDWQVLQLPLAAGLNQKVDSRALAAPELTRAIDVQFDELGGLQTRKPFAALGDPMTNARRIVQNGDELLVFTKDSLLSLAAGSNEWNDRGTHLAAKIDESTVFASNGDQIDGERVEIDGIVLHLWSDAVLGGAYLATTDAATGTAIMQPTSIVGAYLRMRMVALNTKVLLFGIDLFNNLIVFALDPTDPATALAGLPTTVLATVANSYYDVVAIPTHNTAAVAIRRTVTTSYTYATITEALVATAFTKARTCDGPIALAAHPDGDYIQIFRSSGTNLQGDLLDSLTGADDLTAQAIGTYTGTLFQVTGCFRSDSDACHAFWHSDQVATAGNWQSKTNSVTTAGVIGTQATLVRRLGIASHAFSHDGRVYVWGAFAGESSFSGASPSAFRAQLQNTYFLYRDDGFLVAKGAFQRAGGFAPTTGHLQSVSLSASGAYVWLATERRIIEVGTVQKSFGARAPREITVTFDSNEARRTARLGKTLYIACGEGLLQYDGTRLTEVGFHVYPWYFGAIEVGTGNLVDGTYTYKVTLRWANAKGEQDRSTTATHGDVTIGGGPNGVQIVSWVPLHITHKTTNEPIVEVWRTAANPNIDAPFYLVTSKDPSVTSGSNTHITNQHSSSLLTTFTDEYADSVATTKESSPENFGALENLAPPAASVILAGANRLFLAGIAGDEDRVWYSKLRGDGEIAAFHDALTVPVPVGGGAVTGLAFLNETLVVFKETAIYALPGDGFDNNGGGQNYGPARMLSGDVGAVSQESIGLTDKGLVFKSSKGWFLLNRGWSADYIGGPVCDYDSEAVAAVNVVEAQHQIRCLLTSARMLVLDTIANQWAEWTVADGLHATIWQGTHTYLTATGPKTEQATHTGLTYGLDVEMQIHLNGLQGFGRVQRMLLLGEFRSACAVRFRIAANYATDYGQDEIWVATPTSVGGPLQVGCGFKNQRASSFKVRITALAATAVLATPASLTPPTGEALKLTGLGFKVGISRDLYRRLPASQKAST